MPVLLLTNKVGQKTISSYTPQDVDTSYLESILYSLPVDSQVALIPSSTKVIDLLADLTSFTVNAYVQCEKGNGHNEWSSNDWNRLIFPIIANALLALPKGQDSGLLDTMINNWEKSPAVMEELLRNLSLVGAQHVYENRLVELWLYVGNHVLSSERCTSLGYHLNNEMRDILGLLVFADPSIKWKVQEWAPLRMFTDFINSWCGKVGHHPDCFPSLVRLLQTIGFNLLPEFGISWLNDCLLKVKDRNEFFERSGVASQLGELLHDCWLKQGTSIKSQTDILKRFVYLVDIVAEQGNMIAIRLQSILQGKSSQKGT